MHEKYIKAIKEGNAHYFYNSRTWRKKRMEIIERDHKECQRCAEL